MESLMEHDQRPNGACAICSSRGVHRTSWYLVVEDSWLDRLKIFSWHPELAEQSAMHSVCGKRHLELLITHWLTYANLRFEAARMPESVLANHEYGPGEGMNLPHPGQLVGELTVYREPISRTWTGSAEARESIFQALSADGEAPQPTAIEPPADVGSTAAEFVVARADRTVLFSECAGVISMA